MLSKNEISFLEANSSGLILFTIKFLLKLYFGKSFDISIFFFSKKKFEFINFF